MVLNTISVLRGTTIRTKSPRVQLCGVLIGWVEELFFFFVNGKASVYSREKNYMSY